MKLTTVKTQPIYPHDSLEAIFDSHLPKLSDGTIVAITSKVVSLCEGEVAPISNSTSKEQLVLEHADAVLHHREPNPYNVFLTIKNDLLPI